MGRPSFAGLILGDAVNSGGAGRDAEPLRLYEVVLPLLDRAIQTRNQPRHADDAQRGALAGMVVGLGVHEDQAHEGFSRWGFSTAARMG
jgi:hypothetical protein